MSISFISRAINNEQLFFENYNDDQGLVHSYVLCIFQDSRGIIWVGTYGGVQAFTGYSFNEFNVAGKKSNILTNHVVNIIFEDKNHCVWFGTENGLNKYNPTTGEIEQYLHNPKDTNSLSHNNIRTIYQDENGFLWIGTYGGGLNKFNENQKKFTHYVAKEGNISFLQSNLINAFFVDKNGLFWIGTELGGLSVFDKSSNRVVRTYTSKTNELSNSTINSVYQDTYDNIWIGTWEGGLNKYNPHTKTFTHYLHNPQSQNSIIGNNVRSIVQTEKDFLWISTYGEGLNKFNLKTEKFTKIVINTSKDGNSSQDLIWTLIKDAENNLWMGTFGRGLFRMNNLKNTFPYYDIKMPDKVKVSISSVIEDKKGNLWIGTLNRGIFLYNIKDHSYSSYNNKKILESSASKLYIDSKDRIWVGTDNALYTIMPDRINVRRFTNDPLNPKSINKNGINSLLEDSKGNIWIGYWGTGIDVIKSEELMKQNDKDVEFSRYMNDPKDTSSFIHYRVWNLFEDSKGIIWIGTSGNLVYYTPEDNKFTRLPINVASSFYEDPYGYFWVGSIGYGIYKLDKYKHIVRNYKLEDGLPSLDILSILTDSRGRLWLGTSVGLSTFDPRSESITNFDKNYGLQSFGISHNACMVLQTGEMFFGGNNGFNIFKPDDISQDFSQSKIIITDIKLNNKSIAYENVMDSLFTIKSSIASLDTLSLDYKNKVLTIDFAAINYTIPSSITYAYMLEGFDEEWVITSANNRTATYTNLDEGKYFFKVKISYNRGKWIENSKKLLIIIAPPFWKQLWFRILSSLIIISLIYTWYRFKIGRSRLNMLINQKQIFTEKLTKEQELLQLRNEQLTETINQQNKKIASISIKYEALKDYLKEILTSITEQKSENHYNNGQLVKSIEQKLTDLKDSKEITENVSLLYDDFIKRFAESFPKLTATDIRICTLIRMNKSNKEIAKQLSITLGSLETSRHRIRKKLDIPTQINLNDFILRF